MSSCRAEASPAWHRWALLGWALVVVAVVLQAIPFLEGYRRSADEVSSLATTIEGWSSVAHTAEFLAFSQGRLGLLFTVPLNAVASHFSDLMAARLAYVTLHFAVLALFAAYFSLVSASKVTRALLLLLVTLQPLCRPNEFMPPITYPLQNTLPYLWLLLARYVVVVEARREDGGRPSRLWPAYAVFIFALMTTEYAFMLGTSLLLAEYGFALDDPARRGASLRDQLANLIGQRKLRLDVLSVGFALAVYAGFRAVYPSGYEGNVLDGAADVARVLATTFHHAWAGTTFSHDLAPPLSAPLSVPWGVWMAAAVVGIATACGLLLSLPAIRSLPHPLAVGAVCLVVILYVSFPLAANVRQQRWCLEEGACGYLDSRVSYLAVAVIVLSALAWGLRALRSLARPSLTRIFVASVSVVMGAVAALTFLDSWQRSRTMYAEAGAWRSADLLACYPDYQPASDEFLLRMIDRERRVPFHPGSNRADYWRRYMRYAARSADCLAVGEKAEARLEQVKKLGPVISLNQTIGFTAGSGGAAYLGSGWSQPEPLGVWTDGPRAELVFFPREVPVDRQAYLRVRFIPYFGPSIQNQTIEVVVNGTAANEWTMTMDRDQGRWVERFIALPRNMPPNDVVTVVLRIARPRVPSLEPAVPDTRALGIALSAMTLTDSGPPR